MFVTKGGTGKFHVCNLVYSLGGRKTLSLIGGNVEPKARIPVEGGLMIVKSQILLCLLY